MRHRYLLLVISILFSAKLFGCDSVNAAHWSNNTLTNDDAMDFVGEIVENGDITSIRSAFAFALGATKPVDDSLASRALAAAEFVAAARGHASEDFPAEADNFAKSLREKLDLNIISQAMKVIDLILDGSETRDLMMDAGPGVYLEWKNNILDLKRRLK